MRNSRQTYLGFTANKVLTIVGLGLLGSATGEEVPTREAFIFRLPDELLLEIIEFACYGVGFKPQVECKECSAGWKVGRYNNRCVKALSRVCRRLTRLAQPLLFRAIKIEFLNRTVPPTIPVIKLHRALTKHTELRQYCRNLQLDIDDSIRDNIPADYLVARNFAHWLTKTRCLTIHGGFERNCNQTTWDLIRLIVARFKDVEHVRLSREGWGLYLVPILMWLNFSKMKKLELDGISEWKHGNVELELEKHRTASFTSLRISDYEERPESTSLLLQWPAVLTHFEFESFYNNPHVMDYPMFESWLLIHKETLKHIDIGYLSRRGSNRLFNATMFPNLEFLQLSRWQMHLPVQFEAEHANVLGPKLETFGWDFTINDQHNESWTDFGEAEASWIRTLVEVAISHKAALRTIKITFSPDHWHAEEMGYPWDRMDNLNDKLMRPNGMDLIYSQPGISKERWLERIVAERAGSEISHYISHVAENEQSGWADEARESSETEEGTSEFDAQTGYHGEDIRGYLISHSRV